MYPVVALSLIFAAVWVSRVRGSRQAVWYVWWPALMLPVYSVRTWGPVGLELHTVAGLTILVCHHHRLDFWRNRWLLADYVAVGLFLSLALSECLTAGGLGTVLETARRWLLPYALGRLALCASTDFESDLKAGLTALGIGCLVLAFLAAVEAFTSVNLISALFGRHMEYQERWGLRRASGPAENAIGFGAFFVCLMPWALEAARRAKSGHGPRWWRWGLPFALLGVFCTASRGPWMAAAVCLAVTLFLDKPKFRAPMIGVAILALVGILVGRSFVQSGLNTLAGDTERELRFVLNGKEHLYTGTNHRYLQFLVYRGLVDRVGAFGHGSHGMGLFRKAARREVYVRDFPPHVPGVFYSIDSHYLYFLLERGWVGLSLWIVAGLVAVYYLVFSPTSEDPLLRYALAGALVGLFLMLATVFFHPPFEAAWLFALGFATSWRQRALVTSSLSAACCEKSETTADVVSTESKILAATVQHGGPPAWATDPPG